MANKNCRRTELERIQHERAVKVRRMTDEQLCNYLDSLKQDNSKSSNIKIIDDFITYVYNPPSNGIGRGIIARLKAELDNYSVM